MVLLVFAAAWGFIRWQASRTLNSDAVAALRPWLISAFAREALEEVAGKPWSQLTKEELQILSDRLLAAGRVQIKSIRARGSGEDIVCRLEVLVDGQPPPDGKTARYFDMGYSVLTGWTCRGEATGLSYFFALF
ncbi:MAG: hypothetical protein KKC51_09190 [Verrucomicrobia bacterium]|nr:hypothetical protein [Verrucomicrobiota bacterium]